MLLVEVKFYIYLAYCEFLIAVAKAIPGNIFVRGGFINRSSYNLIFVRIHCADVLEY